MVDMCMASRRLRKADRRESVSRSSGFPGGCGVSSSSGMKVNLPKHVTCFTTWLTCVTCVAIDMSHGWHV